MTEYEDLLAKMNNFDSIIKFYSKTNGPAKILSNYDTTKPFVIDTIEYHNGEQAFQAMKFNIIAKNTPPGHRRNKLLSQVSKIMKTTIPNDARMLGRPITKADFKTKKNTYLTRINLTEDEQNIWQRENKNVQMKISMAKLNQIPILREYLLSTQNKYLLHQENKTKNPIWGGRIQKNTGELIGKNELGKIWMMIRHQENNKVSIQDFLSDPLNTVTKLTDKQIIEEIEKANKLYYTEGKETGFTDAQINLMVLTYSNYFSVIFI